MASMVFKDPGLKLGYYLRFLVTISLSFCGGGFSFFFGNLLIGKLSKTAQEICYYVNSLCFCIGSILAGYLLQYGRRTTLLILNVSCIFLMLFILIPHDYATMAGHCYKGVFEGGWIVATYVYAKDESTIYKRSFAVMVVFIVNNVGVILGNAVQFLFTEKYLQESVHQLLVKCGFLGLYLGPCTLQTILLLCCYRHESFRYQFEVQYEELGIVCLKPYYRNRESWNAAIEKIRRSCDLKKFVGVRLFSLLSQRYRLAFLVTAAIFIIKSFQYYVPNSAGWPLQASKLDHDIYAITQTVVKVIITLLFTTFIDEIKRWRHFAICFTLFALANVLSLGTSVVHAYVADKWWMLINMYVITLSRYVQYTFLTYLPYVLLLEVLPDKGVAIILMLYTICCSAWRGLSFFFPNRNDLIFSSFGIYAALSIFGVWLSYTGLKILKLEGKQERLSDYRGTPSQTRSDSVRSIDS